LEQVCSGAPEICLILMFIKNREPSIPREKSFYLFN
jgi:hypothetical protein